MNIRKLIGVRDDVYRNKLVLELKQNRTKKAKSWEQKQATCLVIKVYLLHFFDKQLGQALALKVA